MMDMGRIGYLSATNLPSEELPFSPFFSAVYYLL